LLLSAWRNVPVTAVAYHLGVSDGNGVAAGVGLAGGGIAVDDPRRPDVTALLERHLDFTQAQTPQEHNFTLDVSGLVNPAITFFSYRAPDGELLGVGALKLLDPLSGELKSMHTAAQARGHGIGRAILAHIISAARSRGLSRLYLETGTTAGFEPARKLYTSAGFQPCGTFGGYPITGDNTFFTLALA
jgi:putative acetyltransferase